MTLSRRQFVQSATASLALATTRARAQDYPARPVHLVVGLAAGSSPDIVARLMAEWFSIRLGKAFVVENHPGAGATLATGLVVRAPPDGYTLLQVSSSNAVSASFYPNLTYDFIHDIVPVGEICASPNLMVVNPAFPAKSIGEFIAYARNNPNKINMASAGIGTETHAVGELFKMMSGVKMTHVPYRGGGPALAALVAGQVDVSFPSSSAAISYVKSGTLRALGVSSSAPIDELPSVPTIAEFVPGFEASGWFGIGAPKNTATAIIEGLNGEINAALGDKTVRSRLAGLGNLPTPGSAADFESLIRTETEKWARVAKLAGIAKG